MLFSQQVLPKSMLNIPFDSNPNQTMTYEEVIDAYEKLSLAYPKKVSFQAQGLTDSGEPMHVCVVSSDGVFEPAAIRKSGRQILFINNGIHPGEPDGIDATFMLIRDVLGSAEKSKLLRHLVLVVIPVYNVDGCINRSSFSRANQNGPEAYGFRGNARNFDLNRDFVKSDSRNAQTFHEVFRRWDPDVFIDNHCSNGADYQYTMTLISTHHDKLETPLGDFLFHTMLPALYDGMEERGWEMTPYVDGPEETPDAGIYSFSDDPRYSTGYAALWNTIGFMPETHMLKPYRDRVVSTVAFMETVLKFVDNHHVSLAKARAAAKKKTREKETFVLDWAIDTTRVDSVLFKGYAAKYKASEVSGLPRLWYDRDEPWTDHIDYYQHIRPVLEVQKPAAYIIPQAWTPVIERLERNGVRVQRLATDTEITCEHYVLGDFKTRKHYEGHYLHSDLEIEPKMMTRQYRKGDVVVITDQDANRFIVETLEPHAPDSWFAWNFFDAVLMQKEHYSAYVFEDLAAQFLNENPALRAELEALKEDDDDFAENASAQLDWVYKRSPWYEPTHRLYPVGRLDQTADLKLAP
ncbi:MAG: M14 family metallopeptidase [Saprospiraceae bacterium]|nr:M14 family metallopeptidase [Saprospiraceae bacterium]